MSPRRTTFQIHAGWCREDRFEPPVLPTATYLPKAGEVNATSLGMAQKSPLPPRGSTAGTRQAMLHGKARSKLLGANLGSTVLFNTDTALGSPRPPPPIVQQAMCFIRLVLWGRGEINSSLPQCWKHPLLRAVNSGNFSAQLGAQKRRMERQPHSSASMLLTASLFAGVKI